MNRDEMRAVVQAELEGFPRDGESQNMFRSLYEIWRLNSLGKHPEIAPTSEAAYAAALGAVRQSDPGFVPAPRRR